MDEDRVDNLLSKNSSKSKLPEDYIGLQKKIGKSAVSESR